LAQAGGRPRNDPLEVPVKDLMRLKPCHVLDFLQHFVVFAPLLGDDRFQMPSLLRNDLGKICVGQKSNFRGS
jgi:hypothetical protein